MKIENLVMQTQQIVGIGVSVPVEKTVDYYTLDLKRIRLDIGVEILVIAIQATEKLEILVEIYIGADRETYEQVVKICKQIEVEIATDLVV